MQSDRPRWQKPAIVVLARTRPEEAVMTICKEMATPGAAYMDSAGGCMYSPGDCVYCNSQYSS